MEIKLYDYFEPRDYQLPLWNAFTKQRFKKLLAVWPRRSGKDLVAWNLMIREALTQRVGNYFYCLPTYRQSKLVIWQSMTNSGKRFIDYIPKECIKKINESELKITLINNSILQLIGSDTYNTSLIGTNACMIVFSEFALADPNALTYSLPILRQNDGKLIVLSTPRSRNFFYDLYVMSNTSDEWFSQHLTANDTNHISLEEIQKDIDSGIMSQDMADQEYFCSFDRGQEGTVYGKIIDKLRLENHITHIPHDPRNKVYAAWDLGMSDATAIIFFQLVGNAIYIIDYYEDSGKGLEFYAAYIKQKPYHTDLHIFPHDIEVRELGTGVSRLEVTRSLGLNGIIAPNLRLEDGIEATRSALSRTWFNEETTRKLVKFLEIYHYQLDEKNNVYSRVPVHDSSSHAVDAMRMLAVSLNLLNEGMTPEDLNRIKNKARFPERQGYNTNQFMKLF